MNSEPQRRTLNVNTRVSTVNTANQSTKHVKLLWYSQEKMQSPVPPLLCVCHVSFELCQYFIADHKCRLLGSHHHPRLVYCSSGPRLLFIVLLTSFQQTIWSLWALDYVPVKSVELMTHIFSNFLL